MPRAAPVMTTTRPVRSSEGLSASVSGAAFTPRTPEVPASSEAASTGNTSRQSPTMPMSADAKMAASGSELIARMRVDRRTPTMWLNLPLIPIAM